MKMRFEITMDNAAFEPDLGWELARILQDLSEKVQETDDLRTLHGRRLMDVNGNAVGKVEVLCDGE